MPYISQQRRLELAGRFKGASQGKQEMLDAGELNFCVTTIIEEYREEKGDRYQTFNDIFGALDAAAKEFYRRVVVPYEEKKRQQNGDVYAEIRNDL